MRNNELRYIFGLSLLIFAISSFAGNGLAQVGSCDVLATERVDDNPSTDSCSFNIPSDGFYSIDGYVSGNGRINVEGQVASTYGGSAGYSPPIKYLESGTTINIYASGFSPTGSTSGEVSASEVTASRPQTSGFGGDSFSNSKSTDGTQKYCPDGGPSNEPRDISISYQAPEDGVYQISMSGNADGSEDPEATFWGYINGTEYITGDAFRDEADDNVANFNENVTLKAGEQVKMEAHAESYYQRVYQGYYECCGTVYSCDRQKYSFVEISLDVDQLNVEQPVETRSNTAAPPGSLWIESNTLRWADGSTEYYTEGTETVNTDSPGPEGALWVEGTALHWIDQNRDEKKFEGQLQTGVGGNPGSLWVESGMLHYIDENSDKRAIQ